MQCDQQHVDTFYHFDLSEFIIYITITNDTFKENYQMLFNSRNLNPEQACGYF